MLASRLWNDAAWLCRLLIIAGAALPAESTPLSMFARSARNEGKIVPG